MSPDANSSKKKQIPNNTQKKSKTSDDEYSDVSCVDMEPPRDMLSEKNLNLQKLNKSPQKNKIEAKKTAKDEEPDANKKNIENKEDNESFGFCLKISIGHT